jgi:hypothetical protein
MTAYFSLNVYIHSTPVIPLHLYPISLFCFYIYPTLLRLYDISLCRCLPCYQLSLNRNFGPMRSTDVTFWQGRDLQAVQWTNSVPKPAGYQPACHLHNKVAAGPLAPPVADSL